MTESLGTRWPVRVAIWSCKEECWRNFDSCIRRSINWKAPRSSQLPPPRPQRRFVRRRRSMEASIIARKPHHVITVQRRVRAFYWGVFGAGSVVLVAD